MNEVIGTVVTMLFAGTVVLGSIFGVWYTYKNVQVWGAEMSGRAVLAEAEFSRQARVEEARAKNAAAELEGQAELTRAEFSAKANKALAEGLGGPEAYLRYLYIRMLEESGQAGQIIYIPTEAGMPLLEAGRLNQ
jgi:regulator of protease activity HflC (stomatin/prohibitin superfamily)